MPYYFTWNVANSNTDGSILNIIKPRLKKNNYKVVLNIYIAYTEIDRSTLFCKTHQHHIIKENFSREQIYIRAIHT